MPYVLRGGERFFDRPEIREARLLLRGAAAPGGDGPRRWPTAVRAVLTSLGWYPRRAAARWCGPRAVGVAGGAGRTSPRTWSPTQPGADLAALVAELDQRADAQHAPTVQGVTLASLHSAKGLEWDAVFLVGLTDSTVPIQHATTPEQLAEERRLLYVGITRARERLALSWALARSPGQRRGRRPSRFLDGLRPRPPRAAEPRPGEAARAAGRGRRAVRAAACLAQGAGRGAEGAGLRGVQRRDAGRDRRRPAGVARRSRPDLRRRRRPSSTGTRSRCSRFSAAPTRTTWCATSRNSVAVLS